MKKTEKKTVAGNFDPRDFKEFPGINGGFCDIKLVDLSEKEQEKVYAAWGTPLIRILKNKIPILADASGITVEFWDSEETFEYEGEEVESCSYSYYAYNGPKAPRAFNRELARIIVDSIPEDVTPALLIEKFGFERN